MTKSLNELAGELKALIIELQSDAHNKGNFRPERYNNLKLVMDIAKEQIPHVIVNISMSEAQFNIRTAEKMNGGLGPEEKYVLRWLAKPNTLPALNEYWKRLEANRGKATEIE